MFTAALFTIARTWKQPKSPSAEEQIKKMYIQPQKRTKYVICSDMDLEISQSEVSQTKKDTYHNIMYMWNLKKNGTNELIYRNRVTNVESKLIVTKREMGKDKLGYWD